SAPTSTSRRRISCRRRFTRRRASWPTRRESLASRERRSRAVSTRSGFAPDARPHRAARTGVVGAPQADHQRDERRRCQTRETWAKRVEQKDSATNVRRVTTTDRHFSRPRVREPWGKRHFLDGLPLAQTHSLARFVRFVSE